MSIRNVWLRALIGLHPRAFRARHGREIEEFVAKELDEAGAKRPLVALSLTRDLVGSAVRLRLRGRHRRRDPMDEEGWMMGMVYDFRLVARSLRRSPGFAALVAVTLALGVGLNTALFSVVDAVLLTPLEYEQPDRLATVAADLLDADLEDISVAGGTLRQLREEVPAFEAVEGITTIKQNLNGAGVPRQIRVGWVSAGFLGMLGIEPALGRYPRADDPPGTVVLGYEIWRDALGSEANVLGRTIELDGHPHVVVGVLPGNFRLRFPRAGGISEIDLWKNPDAFWQNGDAWSGQGPEFGLLRVLGRLAPGASIEDAQAQVDRVAGDLRERFDEWEENGLRLRVEALHDRIVEPVRPALGLLLGAVAVLLLIACANVSGLFMVRAHGRRGEAAVRLALGSGRRRLGRLFLLESLVLAVAGSALGLLAAAGFVALVPTVAPPDLPMVDQIRLDRDVLLFALGAALLVTMLVGLFPALSATRTAPGAILGTGRGRPHGGSRVRDGLVVAQVAMSLVLLIGAGLLTSSLARLQQVDPGFDPEGLYSFDVTIPGTEYGWPQEAGQFYRAVEGRVAELPGVESAGVVWPMPFSDTWSGEVEVEEAEVRPLGLVRYELATESYFPTMGIPLRQGRLFRHADTSHVAVVSQSVAERAWPGENPVGRHIRANPWGGGMDGFEIIGVVGDARYRDLRLPSGGQIYFDARSWSWVDWEVHVVVRTSVPEAILLPRLRETVAGLDPTVPLGDPGTMRAVVQRQTASSRFVLVLLGTFALTAGVLAVIGLYGVVSYSVGVRVREIGIRMALGSASRAVQSMVVGQGLRLTALGLALGLLGAYGLSRTLEALLFGVSRTDPTTYLGVTGLLLLATVIASWLPARRASRVDPVDVLKAD